MITWLTLACNVISHLLKVCPLFLYFQLGTVNLCRSVIRSIETARIFDFEEFPRRDKVLWKSSAISFLLPPDLVIHLTYVFFLFTNYAGYIYVLYRKIRSLQREFSCCESLIQRSFCSVISWSVIDDVDMFLFKSCRLIQSYHMHYNIATPKENGI